MPRPFKIIAALLCLAIVARVDAQQTTQSGKVDVARTTGGAVASVSPPASLVGRDVMLVGGNAVDAAVATAFALAVTWPEAGNIGGGGFMMIAPHDNDRVVCVDYREVAPAACDRNSFIAQETRHDSRMVGVPGTVRGLELAHKQYGKLPWSQVVAPAVKLARSGVVVDESLASSLNRVLQSVKNDPTNLYDELRRVYGNPAKREWRPGDILRLPDLANTLEGIAENGPGDFYTGATSQLITSYMKSSGGYITAEDLSGYKAIVRVPIKTHFHGYDVYGPPPPSSGGITIAMILNQLDQLGFEPALHQQSTWTVDQVHLIAEAMRRAFRRRAAHLGDADFVQIPKHLPTREFAHKLVATISRETATGSRDIAGDIPLSEGTYESPQTTHFSVVDQDGTMVSNTYTLEWGWGARVISPGTGVVLNNEMGDFNWYPGYTNLSGRIGTDANLIEPRKRMLSSMTPVIVKQDGKAMLATGSPGGRTIINTVAGVLLQRLVLKRTLPEAVAATRFHHQWFPDELLMESETGRDFQQLVDGLSAKGHNVRSKLSRHGSVHSVEIDQRTGVRTGVSDFRRGGRVAVVDQPISHSEK